MLDTINRIADALGCKACDLLEEVDSIEGPARGSSKASGTLSDKKAQAAQQ
jgi:hypothetical protein